MEERKRPERKIAAKLVPKKKTEVIIPEVKKIVKKKPIVVSDEISPFIKPDGETDIKPKTKPSLDKYIRLAEDAILDERKLINDRVNKGELSFAYYAIDSDKGYHYYLIIK